MGRPKFTIAVTAALVNAVNVGIACTYSSTATESMKSSLLHPSDNDISWIGSTLPLGAVFGGIMAGYLSDKIGRKGVMMYLSILLLMGWLLIAYATSLQFIYAGRFINGICVGLICVVTPMYIVEIATPDIRGNVGCRFQLFICIGIILVSFFGKYLNWNWLAVWASAFTVLAPLCMLFIPESPCWLLKNEKHSEAATAIRFLYGSKWEVSSEFIYENYRESQNSVKIDIKHPTVYKPALLSVIIMFFQQFTGSNAILYYTVSIFKEAKSSIEPTIDNIIVAFVMFSFTLLSTLTIDKLGRKLSLVISALIMCITLNAFSTYLLLSRNNSSLKETYGWIPLFCVLIYIASFSVGLGPIPWLMMSEMSPTHARSLICGLGTAFSWVFAFIITKTFIDFEHLIQDYGTYWIYACVSLLCCFFTIFLPETKGKSFEEIKGFFVKDESQLQRLEEDGGEEMFNPES